MMQKEEYKKPMSLDFTSDINREYAAEMRYGEIDKFMVAVLWWAFGLFALLALVSSYFKLAEIYESPLSWKVIPLQEAGIATAIAFAASIVPTVLHGKPGNHYIWRLLLTISITIYSYLFVFISGGSIEMHFLFFVLIALLAIYSDWRLGWLMLVGVALHHGILNYVRPEWVYQYGRNDVAVVAHAIPVVVIVIFTTILCQRNRNVIRDLVAVRSGLVNTLEENEKKMKATSAPAKKGAK
jgi:hypothetical protein